MTAKEERLTLKEAITVIMGLGWLAFSLMGLVNLIAWLACAIMLIPLQFWTPVPGESSGVSLNCGKSSTYQEAHYYYTFQGVNYEGKSLTPIRGYHCIDSTQIKQLHDEFSPLPGQKNKPITVFVNPKNPNQAALTRRLPPFKETFCEVFIAFLLYLGMDYINPAPTEVGNPKNKNRKPPHHSPTNL